MVNGAFNLSSRPDDLGLECGHPSLQLRDGKRIKILARERGQRIAAADRRNVVHVHGASVDPRVRAVNKPQHKNRRTCEGDT